jgi:hypothetical protein
MFQKSGALPPFDREMKGEMDGLNHVASMPIGGCGLLMIDGRHQLPRKCSCHTPSTPQRPIASTFVIHPTSLSPEVRETWLMAIE